MLCSALETASVLWSTYSVSLVSCLVLYTILLSCSYGHAAVQYSIFHPSLFIETVAKSFVYVS